MAFTHEINISPFFEDVQIENRDAYMASLEAASVEEDIRPFAAFITEAMGE